MILTTTEAAALLNERGYTKRKDRDTPMTADAVKRLCYAKRFPGARLVKHGPGRGYWLIPEEDLEALLARKNPPQR